MSITNPVGWLPYGSSDPSVWFYDPLTSQMNTIANGGRVPSNSRMMTFGGGGVIGDIIHDPVLGMKAYNDGAKWAAYRFQSFIDVGEAKVLDFAYGGQLTFEIESGFLTRADANSESIASTLATDQMILSLSMVAGLNRFLQTLAAGGVVHNNFGSSSFQNYYTGKTAAIPLTSWGTGRFIKVNIGWSGGNQGGKGYIAFDDLLIATFTRNTPGTGLMSDLFLPSSSGGQTSIVNGHFIRNFQMSTRPPMFTSTESLRNIVLWGDSQVKDITNGDGTGMDYDAGPAFDSTVGLSLARNLNRKGLYPTIQTRGYGGFSIANDGVHTGLSTTAAAVKALNPKIILLEAGTNDAVGVGGNLYSGFEADFRALLVDMLGHPTVKFIGLRTVPTTKWNAAVSAANFIANTAAINVIKKAMPAYINTTYPQYAGRVAVVDSYTLLGGENNPYGTFYGQLPGGLLAGVPNNLHYAALGCQVEGKAWADLLSRSILVL